jgi:hypothetical protein
VNPVPGKIVVARLTVPVKPFTGDTTIAAVAASPEVTVTAVGLAAIVKSWKLNVAEAVWVNDPLVPVTVRV